MTALNPLLILLLIAGSLGVLIAVAQVWAASGQGEDPLGERRSRQRATEPPATIPGHFRSLVQGETVGWSRAEQWLVLAARLDELEVELGGTAVGEVPDEYSDQWLRQRITRIENVAGPLPAPFRARPIESRNRLPWKKKRT